MSDGTYSLKFLTPFMLCVLILYISGGTYSFKVDSDRQIFFKNFSCQFQSFCQKSAERKSSKKYFLQVFCFDVWAGARILALQKVKTPVKTIFQPSKFIKYKILQCSVNLMNTEFDYYRYVQITQDQSCYEVCFNNIFVFKNMPLNYLKN